MVIRGCYDRLGRVWNGYRNPDTRKFLSYDELRMTVLFLITFES